MVLLTGGTGYIGGRLLRALERRSIAVRCLCRNPESLHGRVAAGTQLAPGDLLDPATLGPALAGVEGVRRIIFLGGLAQGDDLSPHMRSRLETGNILRASGVPVVELRASIVIGSGSASFELIRALVERLPVMVTPRWVHTAAQPIGIEDVTAYLIEAIEVEAKDGLIVEIGGAEVTSYLGIMREYARQRKLRRWFLAVPFLSPGLSSRWLTLVTPVYASIGRFLIESVRTPSVVRRPEADRIFKVRPAGLGVAVERALRNEDLRWAETRWSDAGCPEVWDKAAAPGPAVLSDVQEVSVPLSPDEAFAPVRRIGGRTGWYFGNWLWRIRGLIDLMTGGVGMRRGRPDPETPLPGSTLDFWRVQIYEPGRRLRLLAEMRVPGRAWLEFRAEAKGGSTVLRQIAYFEPHGLEGLLYWYMLWPIHEVMFRGMLRRIAAAAMGAAAPGAATAPPARRTA
ncbi:MAG: SDR family oxidoreductase [Acidobacteriia bacterium]|nr:SDR family oxidoreductase [Terriglobia bacterium]